MKHFERLMYFILGSLIGYAIVGVLPWSFEKVFLFIAILAVDVAYVIGWVRRLL